MEWNGEEEVEGSVWEKDDSDSYIEIEVDPIPMHQHQHQHQHQHPHTGEEDNQVRISISSSIPLPLPRATTFHPSPLTLAPNQHQHQLKFPRLFNFNLFSQNPQSSSLHHMDISITQFPPTPPCNTSTPIDMLYTTSTRKEGSVRRRKGGMMKMLVKFGAIKLGTLLAFLVKPVGGWKEKTGRKSSTKCRTSILGCYETSMGMNPSDERSMRQSKQWDLNGEEYCFRRTKRSTVEIAQKGGSKTQSCSMSRHTSPIHQPLCFSSADTSIQEAVVYCKTSFQQSDFSFSP